MPIYKVTHNGQSFLIRAVSQAIARSHVAKTSIGVEVASPDDIYELAAAGVKSEELIATPTQKEVGE